MLTGLRGAALYAVTAIVLAVIGAATALAWNGTLSGSDFLAIITPILAGAAGVTSAHVAGQAAAAASQSPGLPAAAATTQAVAQPPANPPGTV